MNAMLTTLAGRVMHPWPAWSAVFLVGLCQCQSTLPEVPPPPIVIFEAPDPRDIGGFDDRAMKASDALLRRRIAEGRIEVDGRFVRFADLTSWRYRDGLEGVPASIWALDGQRVTMTGFMLGFDYREEMTQFILLGSYVEAMIGQAPDVNGCPRVVLESAAKLREYQPLRVVGTFRVTETIEEGECVDIFQIVDAEVSIVR